MTQPLPLKDQLDVLESLQELDRKIDALKKSKVGLPVGLKAVEDSYQKLRTSYDIKKAAIADLEKTQRQTQAALELNQDRATRASGKLEAVSNTNEFQAANKEMEQLKKLSASLDEQLKKTAQDLATATAELAAMTQKFEASKTDRDAHASALHDQEKKLDTEIGVFMNERAQFTSKVEPRMLTYYDRTRAGRAGLGISPAVGGRCAACNMAVQPQVYNDVLRGTAMQTCTSCHRILYVPKSQQ
ncbi:MAG: hypothetical protein H7222_17335 [Methylotenera sp.]|nr:hypothetical protein [Oligoflexia bacterium]